VSLVTIIRGKPVSLLAYIACASSGRLAVSLNLLVDIGVAVITGRCRGCIFPVKLVLATCNRPVSLLLLAHIGMMPDVCCHPGPSILLESWIICAWSSCGGLWGGSWGCAIAVTDSAPLPVLSGGVTAGSRGIGRLAIDSVKSALYPLPTSSSNSGLSATSGVSSTWYVSVNDLSRS
jgi:hypothetical protein